MTVIYDEVAFFTLDDDVDHVGRDDPGPLGYRCAVIKLYTMILDLQEFSAVERCLLLECLPVFHLTYNSARLILRS